MCDAKPVHIVVRRMCKVGHNFCTRGDLDFLAHAGAVAERGMEYIYRLARVTSKTDETPAQPSGEPCLSRKADHPDAVATCVFCLGVDDTHVSVSFPVCVPT